MKPQLAICLIFALIFSVELKETRNRRQAPLHGKVITGSSRDGSFHISQFSSPDGSININNVNAGDMGAGGGFSITNNNVNGASQTIFSNGNGGTVITNTNNNLGPNGFNSNNVNILNNGK